MLVRSVINSVRIGQSRPAVSVWCRSKATATATKTEDDVINAKPFSDMPGPKGLPLVGTLFHTLRNATRMHKMVRDRHREFGPIYREKLGPMDIVFLTDVDGVEQFLRQDGKYPNRLQVEHWIQYRDKKGINKGLVMS